MSRSRPLDNESPARAISARHWALDVSYRALYLEAGSVTVSMSTGENSVVTLGNIWEHQARVGLRYNIW
jgi:hypothetical protein